MSADGFNGIAEMEYFIPGRFMVVYTYVQKLVPEEKLRIFIRSVVHDMACMRVRYLGN
jgi:hypothetical protein